MHNGLSPSRQPKGWRRAGTILLVVIVTSSYLAGYLPGDRPGDRPRDWPRDWPGAHLLYRLVAAQSMDDLQQTPIYTALQRRSTEQEKIRLLVALDISFTPVGELPPIAVRSQQQRIGLLQRSVTDQLDPAHVTVLKNFVTIPYMVLEVDSSGLAALAEISTISGLAEDRQDALNLATSVPNIQGDSAHNAGYTGSGQTIAVIDTGVEGDHDAFAQAGIGNGTRIVAEGCFSTTSPAYNTVSVCPGGVTASTATNSGVDCVDVANTMGYRGAATDCVHGTHVASIMAGNGPGQTVGVAPAAGVIAIQAGSLNTATDHMTFFLSDQLAAMEYVLALHNGGYVIAAVNMSLGGSVAYSAACDTNEQARKAAIDNLRSAGIVTIIAAGNNGSTTGISSPACISSAISVGATFDGNDKIADYSNIGPPLDLLAPGTFIVAALPGNTTGTMSGTSMAAPHVTGAWALLRQAMPTASVSEILAALVETGTPIDDVNRYNVTAFGDTGSGITALPRINVYAAIQLLQSQTATQTVTPTSTSTPTDTPTALPTATVTSRATPTNTATPTPVSTPTLLPTPPLTLTPTGTPSPAVTTTPTGSPTASAIQTATATFVPTAIAMPTPTPTLIPTTSAPIASAEVALQPGTAATLVVTLTTGALLSLQVPAGAVDRPTNVVLTELLAPEPFPGILKFAGVALALDAQQEGLQMPTFSFLQPVTLTINYTDATVTELDEQRLRFYYYDSATTTWRTDGIKIIELWPAGNRMIVTIDHLTDFALFADQAPLAETARQIYLPIVARKRWKPNLGVDLQRSYCWAGRCLTNQFAY